MDKYLNEAAKAVHAKLPDNSLFILMALQPEGTEHQLVYTSNFSREDAINVLKEWLIKASAEEDWMQHIK